jgi:hypothetical protein
MYPNSAIGDTPLACTSRTRRHAASTHDRSAAGSTGETVGGSAHANDAAISAIVGVTAQLILADLVVDYRLQSIGHDLSSSAGGSHTRLPHSGRGGGRVQSTGHDLSSSPGSHTRLPHPGPGGAQSTGHDRGSSPDSHTRFPHSGAGRGVQSLGQVRSSSPGSQLPLPHPGEGDPQSCGHVRSSPGSHTRFPHSCPGGDAQSCGHVRSSPASHTWSPQVCDVSSAVSARWSVSIEPCSAQAASPSTAIKVHKWRIGTSFQQE